mmetsp:Transcript_31746/g.43560  ORF Transcript_31746/g.43560 Transcript_31746/m.43560 type:complete len:1019 (+) Transcript_31746:53-3109(+)
MFNNKCCLFIGNISENCSPSDIHKAFAPFGDVIDTSIKVDPKTGRHLSYGFIKYSNAKSAHRAMNSLNGMMFFGRSLRVGKVVNKREEQEDHSEQFGIPSVHVSYISYQIENLVTESSLKTLFSAYGTVLDASIKKSTVDEVTKFQSGFGFIHYSNKRDGIEAAFKAAMTLYDERIDNVNYTCKISHALEKYLTSGQLEAAAEMEQRKHQQQLSPLPIPPQQQSSSYPRPVPNSSPIETSPRSNRGSRNMVGMNKPSPGQKIGSQSPIYEGHLSIKKKPVDSYYQSSTGSGSPRAAVMYGDDALLSSASLDELPSSGRYSQQQPPQYKQMSKPNHPQQQYEKYSSRWSLQQQQGNDADYVNSNNIQQSPTFPSDDNWDGNYGSHSSVNTNMESRSTLGSSSLKSSSGSHSHRSGIINSNTLRPHQQQQPMGKQSQHNEGYESNNQYLHSVANSISFDSWEAPGNTHKASSEMPRSRPQPFSAGLDIPISGSTSGDLSDSEWTSSLRGTFSSSSSNSALNLSPAIRTIQHSNPAPSSLASKRYSNTSDRENFQDVGDRKSPYISYGVSPNTTTASAGTYSPYGYENIRNELTRSYDSGLYGTGPSIASDYQKTASLRTISEDSESMMSRSMDFTSKSTFGGFSNANNSSRLSNKITQNAAMINRSAYPNVNQVRGNRSLQSLPTDDSNARSRSPLSPISHSGSTIIDLQQKSPAREGERFTYYDISSNKEDDANTLNMSNMRLDMGYSSSSPSTAFGESPSIFQNDVVKKGLARSSPFGFEVDQSPYSITSSSPRHFNSSIQTMSYNSVSTASAYDSSVLRTRGGLEKEIYENFGLFDDLEFSHPHLTSPTNMHNYKQQQLHQQQRLPPKHPSTSTLQMMKAPIIHNEDVRYPENSNQWLTGPDYGFNVPAVNENRSFTGNDCRLDEIPNIGFNSLSSELDNPVGASSSSAAFRFLQENDPHESLNPPSHPLGQYSNAYGRFHNTGIQSSNNDHSTTTQSSDIPSSGLGSMYLDPREFS